MAKIKIKDVPQNTKVSVGEMRKITGGYLQIRPGREVVETFQSPKIQQQFSGMFERGSTMFPGAVDDAANLLNCF